MITTAHQIPAGQWQSRDARETFDLGKRIGSQLTGGEILLLDGPLGAGKTIFAKGIAAALGIDPEEVTSPSFTLVNPYQGRLSLFHIDLYRLEEGATAAHAVDLEELLSEVRAVVLIEWAERLGQYPLPANVWRIVGLYTSLWAFPRAMEPRASCGNLSRRSLSRLKRHH